MLCLSLSSALADKSIRMTFTGDVTLGSEELKRKQSTSFVSVAKEKGYDFFFANYADMFKADDLTVVNLEGPLTDSNKQENRSKTFRFRGDTDFVNILLKAGIDGCNLSNNHTPRDFGTQGFNATVETLTNAGIGNFGGKSYWVKEFDQGIKIAFFGLDNSRVNNLKAWFREEIPRLKAEEHVNAVVFSFHSGTEYSRHRTPRQEELAKMAIDAGADLVIMHHPHIVQGIDVYKNRYICYSLGNFCFGGNKELKEKYNRKMIETVVAGVQMDFDDDGNYIGQQLTLYPAHISGQPDYNDYQPVPVYGEEAEYVLHLIQVDTEFELEPWDEESKSAPQKYLAAE